VTLLAPDRPEAHPSDRSDDTRSKTIGAKTTTTRGGGVLSRFNDASLAAALPSIPALGAGSWR